MSAGPNTLHWGDPFERLVVGQTFRTAGRAVGETDVRVFSALTGDWHPQHTDADWAARSPFGEQIAHGVLILALAVGLVPLDPDRVLALRRIGDVVFKRPVRLGECISVVGEIATLKPLDESAGLVEFAWAVRNQGDALVCRASVGVLWRCAFRAVDSSGSGFWHDPITAGVGPDEFIPVPL